MAAESSAATPAVKDAADVALPGTIRLAGFRGLNLPACVGGTMLYYNDASVGIVFSVTSYQLEGGWQATEESVVN